MPTILTAHNLTQTFGSHVAVNHIDLTIEAGQLVAFLGPNGAGKSTTINMLTGMTRPKTGEVDLAGAKPGTSQFRRQIGVVFQSSVLDDELTVADNLRLRAKMYRNCDQQFIDELIKAFGLETILKQRYGTLSGGQRRRVDIARALLHRPRLLFLDEPSTGLDIQTRNQIWAVLNRFRAQYKLTIVLTTHYLEEADHADYVYVIDHGNIIAAATVADLKAQYAQNSLMITTDDPDAVVAAADAAWHPVASADQVQMMMPDANTTISFLAQVQPLVQTMEYRRGTMDDIFVALTGKEIR